MTQHADKHKSLYASSQNYGALMLPYLERMTPAIDHTIHEPLRFPDSLHPVSSDSVRHDENIR